MCDQVDLMVGQRLRRRRRMLGLTQQELATVCGVSFQQVQKYECAYNRLSVAMLWKVACALEVDVGYFFAGLPHAHGAEPAPAEAQPAPQDCANAA